MRLTIDHVDEAHLLAVRAHKGQKYGNNDYYSYHLCGVLDRYKAMYPSFAPYEEIAVILHDIVEDTDVTLEYIAEKFGDKVAGIVCSMTRRKDETYEHYLRRISRDPCAVKVKLSDSSFNLEESIKTGREKGIVKYTYVLEVLG